MCRPLGTGMLLLISVSKGIDNKDKCRHCSFILSESTSRMLGVGDEECFPGHQRIMADTPLTEDRLTRGKSDKFI